MAYIDRSIRLVLPVLALLASWSFAAAPAAAGSAASFIEDLAGRTIAVLEDRSLSSEARSEALEALMREGLAVKAIGRHVMGRNLKGASPEQVAEYDRLFEEYSISTLVSKLGLLRGVRIKVVGERPDGPNGFAVSTRLLVPDLEPLKVLWRLRAYQGSFKIVDVYIENLSMANAQRSDFSSLFHRHGRNMDAFLAEFRRKIEMLRHEQA